MSSEGESNQNGTKMVAHFELSTASELHVELLKREENGSILFQIYRKSKEGEVIAAEQGIELPIALFPELKRSIAALEDAISDENLASSFKDVEESGEILDQRSASFAHESEREFASILNFYQIGWRYEPRTFPIRWDEEGNVVESFTPDFYLPEYDQYIELTTLKQELVTKKNRKVRLLKKLYPEINIKIMYGKDYRRLLEKYAGKSARKEEGPK